MQVARNYTIGGTTIVPPDPEPIVTGITTTIKFVSAPSNATATVAPRKFNKKNHWAFEWDDASIGSVTALNTLNNAYYTDGCGNNINYSAAIAINGANETSGLEYTYSGGDGKVSKANMITMINAGWEISDHSYFHDPSGFGASVTPLENTQQMQTYIKSLLNYWTRSKVVPTNYAGHATAARDLGYLYSTSTGTFDDFTPEWMYAPPGSWDNVSSDFAPIRRDFTDQWANSLNYLKGVFDTLIASDNKFFRVGSHTIDATAFQSLVDYIVANSNDELLVCSTREWLEYAEMKALPFTQLLSGDTLTITVDLSDLDAKNRWKDLSYNITSDQNIDSVTTTGDSATFNASTGLVNIFKQNL